MSSGALSPDLHAQGEPRSAGIPADAAARATAASTTLIGALVALVLYAAFAGGAASLAAQARVQTAVSLIAAVAAAGLLWTRTLRFASSRTGIGAVALLAAFALWSAIGLAWSIAPDSTWTEFNRVLTYVLVLGLAAVAGASSGRGVEMLARGFLIAVMAVALYGIGQKIAPGVHVAGLFTLNHPEALPRLEAPLGYWNALALYLGMGTPLALMFAIDTSRSRRARLAALLSLEVLLLTTVLTYSRGGLLATVVGLAVAIALSASRLRAMLWLAVAAVAMVIPLLIAVADPALNSVSATLRQREINGLGIAVLLLVSMWVLRRVGRKLIALESTVTIGPERARRIGRMLGGAAAAAVLVAVLVIAVTGRGLTGTVSHAWDSFTGTRGASVYSPSRLLSVDSENRWVWWKEAAGAFSDRPLTGWGPGSFGAVQPLYSTVNIPVKEPHSLPLQLLAETGVIGALLALSGIVLLLAAGLGAVRRAPPVARGLTAALFGAVVMYALHTLYDWDWDIPGVTFPMLVCAGVLIGSVRAGDRARSIAPHDYDTSAVRVLAIAAAALMLFTVALSAVLPSLAASRATAAQLDAATATSASDRTAADAEARVASSLDPLSGAGLRVQAEIALRGGQLRAARSLALDAIRRQPTDVASWQLLLGIESALHNDKAALAVSHRIIALQPADRGGRRLAVQLGILFAPPQKSATSVPTPLPTG